MNVDQRSFSQCGEDKIVDFLLTHVLNIDLVVYLDVGANDPIEFNNTYLLYLKGARGVSIDANPFFEAGYKQHRPEDIFVSAGAGPTDNVAKFYVIDPHTLSTFSEVEANRYTKDSTHKLLRVEPKPILSITSILEKYFARKLPNFLSIDVEGYDLQILQSIDFKTWRPAAICAETLTYTTDAGEQKVTEIIELLKTNDYLVYADTYINTIFVDKHLWSQRG